MTETPKGVLESLEQLRQERDELNVLIQGLERRLGVVSNEHQTEAAQAKTPRVTVSVDSIPVGFFHNLSQADATELRHYPAHQNTCRTCVCYVRVTNQSRRLSSLRFKS